jgi:predicted transcriptional regulator of viral defense system
MSPTGTYRAGAAAAFVERLQARGFYGFALETLLPKAGLSPAAAAAQLRRLAPGVVPLYPRARYYLIVPPEHRSIGAPPITWWIDSFFAAQGEPYYLGLLTAAAHHGVQHQVPQITQVMTARPRRPLQIGRLKVVFVTKKTVSQTPTMTVGGGCALFQVSTPEATIFDLLRYPEHIGGVTRVAELIAALEPKLTPIGFREALSAPLETALLQRMGFLLDSLDMVPQSRVIATALKGRRLQPTALQTGSLVATTPPNRWKVQANPREAITPDNRGASSLAGRSLTE